MLACQLMPADPSRHPIIHGLDDFCPGEEGLLLPSWGCSKGHAPSWGHSKDHLNEAAARGVPHNKAPVRATPFHGTSWVYQSMPLHGAAVQAPQCQDRGSGEDRTRGQGLDLLQVLCGRSLTDTHPHFAAERLNSKYISPRKKVCMSADEISASNQRLYYDRSCPIPCTRNQSGGLIPWGLGLAVVTVV